MIKNWKIFLESINNDDELDESTEELKRNLKEHIEPILAVENQMRRDNKTSALNHFVQLITKSLIVAFGESIANSEFPEEIKDMIMKKFIECVNDNTEIMINDSFIKGIDFIVDALVETIDDIAKANDREGEEWRDEKPLNYEELTKSELNDLINQALDSKDYTRVKFLAKYLKESIDQYELENILKVIAELITKYLTKIYSKKYI